MCLSAFYIGKGDKTHKTGVYRGCFARRPDVRDQCEYFREQNQQENVNVVSCLPCTEARCNVHLFDDKGLPKNSVTKNASSVLLTFVINILIVSISLLYRS
ncbi:unnamed protein product [Acanthoscelides obtectus]|nr:unnamed protein product [Acanthoscelides obtectus]CAK1631845.1 hypothetical protein AOBTE_LOCUS7197 [Acanthoscelides obtectus]